MSTSAVEPERQKAVSSVNRKIVNISLASETLASPSGSASLAIFEKYKKEQEFVSKQFYCIGSEQEHK